MILIPKFFARFPRNMSSGVLSVGHCCPEPVMRSTAALLNTILRTIILL